MTAILIGISSFILIFVLAQWLHLKRPIVIPIILSASLAILYYISSWLFWIQAGLLIVLSIVGIGIHSLENEANRKHRIQSLYPKNQSQSQHKKKEP